MTDEETFLTEALEKTVRIINTVDSKYHEAAFPLILRALIEHPKVSNDDIRTTHQPHSDELKLPASISVNEFFRKVKPNSHPERFVCAAYFLLHTGKAEQLTVADILEIYGKLREPKPKNPPDVLNQCIRKAHIIDGQVGIDKQKRWVITPDGENFVEELLNDTTISNGRASR